MATPNQRSGNMNRLGIVARNAANGQGTLPFQAADSRPCKLSKYRKIGDAWQEWMHGIGGNKPAKDWTPAERRQQKSTYCRRLPLWKLMSKMCTAGLAPSVFIHRIDIHYGPVRSIGAVADRIKKDTNDGTLPTTLTV